MSELPRFFEKTERVNGFECDFNGKWKPSAIFQHLTEAASQHAELLGFGFNDMVARNLFWVHSRMKIEFYDFPKVWEEITIRTWPKTIQQKLFFIRDFEMLNASGERLAAATSAWLVINAATRRLVPTQVLNLDLPVTPGRSGLDEPLEKLGLTQQGEEKLRVKASYSAVDMLGHATNSRYIEWICDCFDLDTYRNQRLDWMQINYDHEIRPGETVALLAHKPSEDDGLWTVEGTNLDNQTRAFESVLHWSRRE